MIHCSKKRLAGPALRVLVIAAQLIASPGFYAWNAFAATIQPEPGNPLNAERVAKVPPGLAASLSGPGLGHVGSPGHSSETGVPQLRVPSDPVSLPVSGDLKREASAPANLEGAAPTNSKGAPLSPENASSRNLPSSASESAAAASAGTPLSGDKDKDGSQMFDGEMVRVYFKLPGQNPVSVNLKELPASLADDSNLRGLLSRERKRVRLVVSKDGSNGLTPAQADAVKLRLIESGLLEAPRPWRLRWILTKMGLTGPEVVEFSPSNKNATATLNESQAPVKSQFWRFLGATKTLLLFPLEIVYLARLFIRSFTRPNPTEIASGLASNGYKFFSITLPLYAATFLPKGQWAAFAAFVSLDLALNLYHNFLFTNWWNNFANGMARLRGMTYLYVFSICYGIFLSGIFRLIAWLFVPDATGPFSWIFLLQSLSVIAPGAYAGTLGTTAGNELYNKGYFTRTLRTLFQHGRKWLTDSAGAFLNTGALGVWLYVLAAAKIAFDVGSYAVMALLRERPIIYVAPEKIASSQDFRTLYLARSPTLVHAVQQIPFAPPLIAMGKWLAKNLSRRKGGAAALAMTLSVSPQTVADLYRVAKHDDIALGGGSILHNVTEVEPVLELDGQNKLSPKSVGAHSIEAPILVKYPDGALGVFKRIVSVKKTDPMYKYKRLARLADVIGSDIMETVGKKMGGVPTIRYELATTTIDGRKYLGDMSRYLDIETLKDNPELGKGISNVDEFLRGCIIDAWMGNPDRAFSPQNVWVLKKPAQDGGRTVIFGDFNANMRLGIEMFGVPKVPAGLFAFHAQKRPQVVRDAIAAIAAMSDKDISALVDGALSKTPPGYGASSREYLVKVLIYNRDAMRRPGVFESFTSDKPHRLRLTREAVATLAKAVLPRRNPLGRLWPWRRRGSDWISAQVDKGLKDQGFIHEYKPELLEPTKRLFEELVRRHVNEEKTSFEYELKNPDVFLALLIFTYLRVDPEAAIEAELGFNR